MDGQKLNSLETQLPLKTQKPNIKNANPPQEAIDSLLTHCQNGRFAKAEKLAISITQEFPQHPIGWKLLGAVLLQTARFSEAVNVTKQQSNYRLKMSAHINLGTTLGELGRLDEAEASYSKAIALKPDYAEAHCNLGITLQKLGRLDAAEASYSQAIELKPNYAEAHNNLGNTLKKMGRLEAAEASYTQAIELKPDFAEAHFNFGNILEVQGRLEAAETSYTQSIKSKPDFAEAHYNLGNTLKKLGRLESAEEVISKR